MCTNLINLSGPLRLCSWQEALEQFHFHFYYELASTLKEPGAFWTHLTAGGVGGVGGGQIPPPKISETDWRNIKCVVLVDSYDPPESIGTKKVQTYLVWHHSDVMSKTQKSPKIAKSWFFAIFLSKSCIFWQWCVSKYAYTCMFLLQINQINKIKHSESVSWKQKTRFVCNFHWKSVFVQFFVGPSALLRNAAS